MRAPRSAELAAGALLALLSACVAPPPALVEGRLARVRADTLDEARDLAVFVDELVPRLRAEVPGLADRDLTVWVQDQVTDGWGLRRERDVQGLALRGDARVHVQREAIAGRRSVLVHELVHLLRDDVWARLPPGAEEGLAEAVSVRYEPGGRHVKEAIRLFDAATTLRGLELHVAFDPHAGVGARVRLRVLPARDWPAGVLDDPTLADPDPDADVYALAFVLMDRAVGRVGFDGVYALCAASAGRVPVASLRAAAGLGLDADDWHAAALGAITPEHVTLYAERTAEVWVGPVVDALRGPLGTLDAEAMLARAQPRLHVPGVDVAPVVLARIPSVRAALVAAWEGRSPDPDGRRSGSGSR